ncbi:hypothetical protein GCM10008090_07780 [Arenicella chitinivorans]|uniref:DUF1887 family protein n=1 Tax=Arenicella chitinivorans TaxID=1329800 RepID=A0A918RK41_9GAMM|nr:hypothetical protein GCM10008090_07780 [Arenicella chitinivorans]
MHDTAVFVNTLVKKYLAQKAILKELQPDTSANIGDELFSLDDVDVHNTNVLADEANLGPIADWLKTLNVDVSFNPDAADTTGFFDEIALHMGQHVDAITPIVNQIKYIQGKGYANVKFALGKFTEQDQKTIRHFCQELYDYSFVAKYFYHKKEKFVRLTLQTAPKIRAFFHGVWMEWFALITVLKLMQDKNLSSSCARSVDVRFQDGSRNELDIVLVSKQGQPICIECKSGEFRHDIEKYLTLRKRLKLSKQQFVLCVFGLSDEQATGMTAMYEITFVNERTLAPYIESQLT